VQGWHLDETAAQLTLEVTATRTRVRCPLCQTSTGFVANFAQDGMKGQQLLSVERLSG
jgi:hypothetical protein